MSNWQYTINQTREGWKLQIIDQDSNCSFPNVFKPTKEEIVARLMQELEIQSPVAPQSYPERIEIGFID